MILFYLFFITATKTVLDIKIDVSMLTNIPVSKQVWRGWPESIADELSLAQIGISKKHKLYVKPKDDTSRNVSNYNEVSILSRPKYALKYKLSLFCFIIHQIPIRKKNCKV